MLYNLIPNHLERRKHVTLEDLNQIKSLISGLRFIQAASLVESGLNENKQAIAYMTNLARLSKAIEQEIKEQKS
jgi:hypothetical protein